MDDEQRPTIAPHYSDIFVRVGDGDGAIFIPTGDFVLGDDGHFRRVVTDGQGGYRRDDDYFAPLRDGTITIPEHSAFEGTFRIVMSDVDPEDESLDDLDVERPDDLVCLVAWGPSLMFVRRTKLAGLRPDADLADHGKTLDEHCPECDGEEDEEEDASEE
jgi:hypothetical protein